MDDRAIHALETRIFDWLHPQAAGLQKANGAFALGTAKGVVRQENQDRILYGRLVGTADHGAFLQFAILCDGMGGMVDGGRCAELAVAAFAASLVTRRRHELEESVRQAVFAANARVHAFARGKGGTTLSAFVLAGGRAQACHVGDSRIYVVPGSGEPRQISIDDTIAAQLDAIRGGQREPAADHERLVQHVGMGDDLLPHLYPVDSASPARIVLLSDGAYRPAAAVLTDILRHAPSPAALVERLLELPQWLGGRDNVSAIAVDVLRLQTPLHSQPTTVLDLWGPSQRLQILAQLPITSESMTVMQDAQRAVIKEQPSRAKRRRRDRRSESQPPEADKTGPLAIEVGTLEDLIRASNEVPRTAPVPTGPMTGDQPVSNGLDAASSGSPAESGTQGDRKEAGGDDIPRTRDR